MSGVATQPPPGGPPPGPHEPHATNGGPEAAETNGSDYKGPGQTNGPPGPGGRGPPSAATAAQTQKMLDENSSLINTISEYQKMGRHQETMSYQVRGNCLITITSFASVAAAPQPDDAGPDGRLYPEPAVAAAAARTGT